MTASVMDEEFETHEFSTWATVIVTEDGAEPGPEPGKYVYTVNPDSDTSWTKGSNAGAVITVKRSADDDTCFDHFSGVTLDGKTLTKDKDYTAVKGSTVVTLKADYLESLSEGTHTVAVMFDDGQAETTLKIVPAKETGAEDESDKPKTGDVTNFMWFFIMILSVSGLAAMLRKSNIHKN